MRAPWVASLVIAAGITFASADAPMGVTSSGGFTTFRVWAPHAGSVEVIGDFNGWRPSGNDRLVKDPDTGVWSVTQKRGRPRGNYQFLINGELRRRDPYARAVSSDGKSSQFYDPAAFDWEGDRPLDLPAGDLVIYELHVGTFNDPDPRDGRPGTFADAARRLDQIASLGVNCVLVMPVHEFDGMHSWGYNPCDSFAVEQSYGGPDGFKAFVKACHRRGIAVHLDIVHNHYGPENLTLLRFDGTGNERDGGIYFYEGPGINMTPWGPRVRFDDPMVRRYVRDNAIMWLEEYHVDGFRWDSTVNIRAHENGARPIPAGARMLEEINAEIRERFPGRMSIAEDSLDIGNFDGSWDYDFHHLVMGALGAPDDAGRSPGQVQSALFSRPRMLRVVYVDNHDEAGKINGQFRIATDIDPRNPDGDKARRLSGLGALLTFTAPGIPLHFMGNEMQDDGSFHDDRPLDWNKWQRHEGVVKLHRDLIRLRRNLDGRGNALKGMGIELGESSEDGRWFAYHRWDEGASADPFVVAVNLSSEPRDVAVVFPSGGLWRTEIDTDWPSYGGAAATEDRQPVLLEGDRPRIAARLAPHSGRIYARAKSSASVPARKVAQAEAPRRTAADKPAFSMYASLHVAGTFNDWSPTGAPMTLVSDGVWEARATWTAADEISFKLSANDDGVIYWGAGEPMRGAIPYRGTFARLGGPVTLAGVAAGDYLVRFDEQSLAVTIEPAAPEPSAGARDRIRTWTDVRGKKLEARLLRLEGDAAVLALPGGDVVRVKVAALCEEDQAILRAARGDP